MTKDEMANALTIDEIRIGSDHITFSWSGGIGWGEYNLWFDESGKWYGDSECLDSDTDKTFLKLLLGKFAESIEVKG